MNNRTPFNFNNTVMFHEADGENFQGTGDFDSIFGLGNKQKQADRKMKRAENKLEKGKTKAAARLTEKANKTYQKINLGKTNLASAQNLNLLNNTLPVLDRMNVQSTEDMNTNAGQIGATADTTTMNNGEAQLQAIGGGGYGDYPLYEQPTPSDTPTGALAEEKTLSNVTVTAKKKKDNTVVYLLIGVAVLYLGYKFILKK